VSVGRARILLVEDELALLQLLERYLQRVGFDVQTYSSSFQALRKFEAAPGRYDLVIADLGLPEIPGDTMVTRMLEIQPDLLILICSGSFFNVLNLPKAMEHQVGFLQKPFLPKMMFQAIETLLAQKNK
jgi:two-component system, cell cycle sensor histidine kinase and response regulator CckA